MPEIYFKNPSDNKQNFRKYLINNIIVLSQKVHNCREGHLIYEIQSLPERYSS